MEKKIRMNDMPLQERPYEKCYSKGPQYLTEQELLAIILRTGSKKMNAYEMAGFILNNGKNTGILSLMHYSKEELMEISGIGKVKAIQLLCIGELSKRIASTHAENMLCFSKPDTIAEYYMEKLRHNEIEQLVVAYLNTKCMMIKELVITQGTVNQSLVSPREIFLEALKCNAVNIVLIHNHPSGDPAPSRDDVYSTKRIRESGKLVGINIIDHIIIGDKKYTSLNQIGIL